MSISILLVDDHPVFRKGLHLLLKEEGDMQVIGEAGDGQAAIEKVRALSPDLVVMDITMPNFNGIEATRKIVSESPDTRVVALSIHSGKRFVEGMLGAGAGGYILKLSAPEELVEGIRTVMKGEVYLSAGISGIVVSQYLKLLSSAPGSRKNAELTQKEIETLQLIAEGHTIKQIASILHISPKTVQSIQHRIMEKMEVSNEAEIAGIARQMGLLDERGASVPAHEIGDLTVLRTKLHRLSLSPDVVPRAHLVARLDELLRRPVTLVSSAAGYGKSTLASLWLKAWNGPSGWVSLDKSENDLRNFMTYLLAAIRSSQGAGFAKACDNTQSLLQAPGLPPLAALSRNLLNDLDEIETQFILVLDDYHKISDPKVHELMSELLIHPTRSMHLILLTRRDPPLPIGKLRGRGQINEIGISQLRFTVAETTQFLKQNPGLSIDEATAAAIHERIEGWVAGLHLMAHSLRNRQDVKHILDSLQGSFGSIVEYLMAEVLSQQSAEMSKLMVETAILNRFCASLCDALCGRDISPDNDGSVNDGIDGEKFIAHLKTNNFFLIPLDAESRWFRYHHLFQDLLLGQLKRRYSAKDISDRHSRASEWFAENGFIDEAVRHKLAAGDMPQAAHLVEQHRQAMLNSDRWHVFENWLTMFPDTEIEQRPELMMARVWVCYYHGENATIPPILAAAESLLSNEPKEHSLYGEIYLFKAVFSFWQGDISHSLKYIEDALERIPETQPMVRGFAEIYFGLTGQMGGQKERVPSASVHERFSRMRYHRLSPPKKRRITDGADTPS